MCVCVGCYIFYLSLLGVYLSMVSSMIVISSIFAPSLCYSLSKKLRFKLSFPGCREGLPRPIPQAGPGGKEVRGK